MPRKIQRAQPFQITTATLHRWMRQTISHCKHQRHGVKTHRSICFLCRAELRGSLCTAEKDSNVGVSAIIAQWVLQETSFGEHYQQRDSNDIARNTIVTRSRPNFWYIGTPTCFREFKRHILSSIPGEGGAMSRNATSLDMARSTFFQFRTPIARNVQPISCLCPRTYFSFSFRPAAGILKRCHYLLCLLKKIGDLLELLVWVVKWKAQQSGMFGLACKGKSINTKH